MLSALEAIRLVQVSNEALARFLAGQPGRTTKVLLERGDFGRTEQYAPIRLDFAAIPGAATPGSVVAARITGSTATELTGQLAA